MDADLQFFDTQQPERQSRDSPAPTPLSVTCYTHSNFTP